MGKVMDIQDMGKVMGIQAMEKVMVIQAMEIAMVIQAMVTTMDIQAMDILGMAMGTTAGMETVTETDTETTATDILPTETDMGMVMEITMDILMGIRNHLITHIRHMGTTNLAMDKAIIEKTFIICQFIVLYRMLRYFCSLLYLSTFKTLFFI